MAASAGQGSDYLPDLAYEAVHKLQPALKRDKALILARAFEKAAGRCGIDWRLLVSIAYHESSLKLATTNARTKDYGLMQINAKNILRYGLSRDRLMKDAAYSLEAACMLLKDNRDRYSSKYPYWVGIYRSGTALWRKEIKQSAISYDNMIRRTASRLGYHETRYAKAE